MFNTFGGIEIENEDIIFTKRNTGTNLMLNIQNSPLEKKYYYLTFQQKLKVSFSDTCSNSNKHLPNSMLFCGSTSESRVHCMGLLGRRCRH